MKASPNITKVIVALNKTDLSMIDKSLLISAILTKLAAIPLRDIIYADDKGNLFVSDVKIEAGEAQTLRESAVRVLDSKAFKLIREQVVYKAFAEAAHRAPHPEDLVFFKAALWWGQQEDALLKLLSYENRNGNSSLLGDY